MADLIYGLPIDLLDDWIFGDHGEDYSNAKVRVTDTGASESLVTLIAKQTQLIDLLLLERDTQKQMLNELKKTNVYLSQGMSFHVKDTDIQR